MELDHRGTGLEGFMRLIVALAAMLFASGASAVLPLNADPVSGDTIRFQHSFRFTDFAYQWFRTRNACSHGFL